MALHMHSPAHPGALLREEILRPLNLTVTAAAEILKVGRPALSSLLNERAALSPEMALRIEKAFGLSMELLLKMQLQYDIAEARRSAGKIRIAPYRPAA
ncbi:MAG: HigA family addiction module antitoxin [Hyphomicrobiales bacterium]